MSNLRIVCPTRRVHFCKCRPLHIDQTLRARVIDDQALIGVTKPRVKFHRASNAKKTSAFGDAGDVHRSHSNNVTLDIIERLPTL